MTGSVSPSSTGHPAIGLNDIVVTLTGAGRAALAEEINQLKRLISQIERTDALPEPE
ncbi:MAG TPA: hypothetical protein VGZ32_19325 [Actinocrinis sp.]|jgi:hypothetical protein|uniref:hypothetical protein n=1 Tax=Actinocrinis sp. TaxID=1920516 RepID=UPI002DDDBA9B|nr:hypothetical protein [Actinocrinis sp.]HEV3172506.1 hypothetical protein [Actinocrinis sp.]